MGQLEGKVAVVTGGCSGIGRAVAIGLAREGAQVVVSDVRIPAAESPVVEIQNWGCQALAVEADVSQSRSVSQMVQKTLDIFGRIDILVNSAGIVSKAPVVDMSEEEWARVIGVNLTGTFLCCKAVARHMIAQRSGKIVNMTSGRGVTGMSGAAHYAASKGGIIAFTVSLGIELGPYGINVNAIAPGVTDTRMTRSILGEEELRQAAEAPVNKRLGKPEDVVGPVLFLVTDASKDMYGQILYMRTP